MKSDAGGVICRLRLNLDPNKVLQLVGVNLGFGKRLKWPDDYFTFTAELG